ncbi:MAG: DnaD domain protein [Acholeplasma sp.]|nr:DnaD domain protein [Acholeplasma sp.]
MFKKLVEEGYLNAHKILLKEQTRLNISPDEIIILSALITLLERKKMTVSMQSLAKLTTLNSAKVGEVFNHLIESGLVQTELELKSDGKEKEVFSLNPLFSKIEQLFKQDLVQADMVKQTNDVTYIISKMESVFNKSLTPFELEIVKEWFSEGFTKSQMDQAIEVCINHNRKTANYMDRVIRSNDVYDSNLDEEKKQTIHKLIRGIR